MLSPWLCAAWLAFAPAAAPDRPAVAPSSRKEDFNRALLATQGLDQAALVDSLAMRVPDLKLLTQWKASDSKGQPGTIFLDLHLEEAKSAGEPPRTRVDVVLADGRAFRRELQAGPDDARVIASFVSNLLLSIEEASIEADQEGVALPETSKAADVAAVVEKLDGEDEAPEPERFTPLEQKP